MAAWRRSSYPFGSGNVCSGIGRGGFANCQNIIALGSEANSSTVIRLSRAAQRTMRAFVSVNRPVVADFAIIDDHDLPVAGDQRVQEMAYNPDKDEFLIAWADAISTLEGNSGVRGRVFGSDGTPKGDVTVIGDGPKNQ